MFYSDVLKNSFLLDLLWKTGPVRLFVPYKRRKKDLEGEPMLPPNKKPRIPSMSVKSPIPQQMGMTVPKLEMERGKRGNKLLILKSIGNKC